MANNTNDSRQTYKERKQRIYELTEQLKSHENREYKSRLFSFIFGREENKHWTLSLYNAIHGTSHEELSSITINTIEDVVRMININYGHNKSLLTACKPLEEYAWFVAQIRGNIASNSDNASNKIEAAIDRAIHDMPKDFEIRNFLISNFLISNRAEVKDMCLTEYNETETLELFRQEGWQEGRLEGQQEMMLLNIRNQKDILADT